MADQQNDVTPGKKKPDAKTDQERPARHDRVDETVKESFPGSDAPGGWAGRDIPPDERKKTSH